MKTVMVELAQGLAGKSDASGVVMGYQGGRCWGDMRASAEEIAPLIAVLGLGGGLEYEAAFEGEIEVDVEHGYGEELVLDLGDANDEIVNGNGVVAASEQEVGGKKEVHTTEEVVVDNVEE